MQNSNPLLARVFGIFQGGLVVLSALSMAAAFVILVWLVVLITQPVSTHFETYFEPPSYTEIRVDWYNPSEMQTASAFRVEDEHLQNIFSRLDALYGLVGRREPTFSERDASAQLAGQLFFGISNPDDPEVVSRRYIADVLSFATQLSEDEALKRVADGDKRTATILSAMLAYRDKYSDNLTRARHMAAQKTLSMSSQRDASIKIYLNILAVVALTLFASAIAALVFFLRARMPAMRIQISHDQTKPET